MHFIFKKYLSVLDSLSTCDIKFCIIQATKVYLSYHFALLVECVVNIMLLLLCNFSSLNLRSQILGQLKVAGFIRPRGAGDIRDLNSNSSNWAVVKV